MSTPHPIKTRLSRVPPKQQKRVSLVRSHSMPESLDKLHRRKKLLSAIGIVKYNILPEINKIGQ